MKIDNSRPIRSLNDIFNDPAADELLIKPKKKQVTYDPEVEKFKEIENWVKKHNGKEPEKTTDLSRLGERKLASRLKGIREAPERIELLKPYDKLGLLKQEDQNVSLKEKVSKEKMSFNSLDDILNDNSILFDNSGSTLNSKLFDTGSLNKYKKLQENKPENKSKRKAMEGFSKYKPLFEEVQKDLTSGRRHLARYENNKLQLHHFYVLNGQLLYIESIGSEFKNKTRSEADTDARLHVIYENGTENYPLRNGLIASLYGSRKRGVYGKAVTEPDDKFEFSADDQVTGYVYVLKSLSNNADVKRIQEDHPLYKVGFTSGTVERRIANAENESTYLYGPVKVVAEYQVINLNPEALETALHHALTQYRLDVDIRAGNGKIIHPREWFIVDLNTINNLVSQIISKLQIDL
ncbi:GIY-YIG nuclease family protein (plasmid) [Lactobacillus amylovorus]|uniref:GIY-YIG nuclease family protein n=1 Tax=Lactobacillus amylovorus TaxID=1604 RepID=A0A5E8CR19_LACAM|nr:GIY-YIG nuclease family protein [Lactobacillus amylovorus]MDY5592939.1 GIY-YIG nuclease family protein [Limosilactobacillus reuteri]QDD71317.1 GIY-YIG nuclease family protein [Lactobacillus amylovorus]